MAELPAAAASSPATQVTTFEHATAARCADCDAPVQGRYCAACGQETRIETPTVRHFLQEFIDQYVALEGKLGRTLRVLVVRPGQLTLDYIEGRRQRYVRPLKLYLSVSLIFFTLLGLLPDANNPFLNGSKQGEQLSQIDAADRKLKAAGRKAKPDDRAALAKAQAGIDAARVAVEKTGADADNPAQTDESAAGKKSDEKSLDDKPADENSPDEKSADRKGRRTADENWFESTVEKNGEAFGKLAPEEQRRILHRKLADDAPFAMFFLLPYFAFLLKLAYRKQKLRYGVHLLFSLHVHSFMFIALSFGFLPLPDALRAAIQLGLAAYLFLALRRVYGGTIVRTVWRIGWLALFYVIAAGVTAASGVLTTVLGVNPL